MKLLTMIEDFFRNVKYGLQNYWIWAKIIYRDRDWDWCFLYQIIEFKLLRMAKLHRRYGICTNSEELAKEMEEAAGYLRKLYEDEYYYEYYDANGYKATLERQKQDLKKFCELFESKSKTWWD